MKVVVGAPVCDRDWALPHWFECLQAQTRPPDEYVFVVKELPHTRTTRLLRELGPEIPKLSYAMDTTPYIPRHDRNEHPQRYVYGDFAWRRNKLLAMVRAREPDVFVSLDSDIMLEDRTVLERLLDRLEEWPVAAPCTFLHPAGEASECFNAGMWVRPPRGIDPEQPWFRLPADSAREALQIGIPMAVLAMRAEVLACRYHWHMQGEDLGFAQELAVHGHGVLWDPGLRARHVMSEDAL